MALFGKKSFMKITNAKGVELCRRPIDPVSYYVHFCAYGKFIAGLYEHAKTRTSLVEVYTDELKLVSSRLFDVKLEQLVFINKHELVCKTHQSYYQYVFFNFGLEPTFSFRVLNKDASGDGEVILLGSTPNELYLYHNEKRFLKVLSRIDGKPVFAVDFDKMTNLDNVSNVCLHESGCLIFKCNATRRLNCFEYETNRLTESTSVSNLNVHFKSFNLDSFDHIYSCDNLNKKIYFL